MINAEDLKKLKSYHSKYYERLKLAYANLRFIGEAAYNQFMNACYKKFSNFRGAHEQLGAFLTENVSAEDIRLEKENTFDAVKNLEAIIETAKKFANIFYKNMPSYYDIVSAAEGLEVAFLHLKTLL